MGVQEVRFYVFLPRPKTRAVMPPIEQLMFDSLLYAPQA